MIIYKEIGKMFWDFQMGLYREISKLFTVASLRLKVRKKYKKYGFSISWSKYWMTRLMATYLWLLLWQLYYLLHNLLKYHGPAYSQAGPYSDSGNIFCLWTGKYLIELNPQKSVAIKPWYRVCLIAKWPSWFIFSLVLLWFSSHFLQMMPLLWWVDYLSEITLCMVL